MPHHGRRGDLWLIQSDPDYFAAGGEDFLDVSKIKDIPIWAFHGNQDKVCPIDRDQKIFAEMKEIGSNMKFTTWDGDGHGVAVKMITGSDWQYTIQQRSL